MTFYNDNNRFAAAWLRNMVAAGMIPQGDVSEQSICEIESVPHQTAHFFGGVGGWPLALRLAGWPDSWPVWSGSAPCQPFSDAGKKRGVADSRHLWPQFFRLINLHRPSVVFGEQVASKDGRKWLAGVRSDMEGLGYRFGAADLCAACSAAPHIRQRLFWVTIASGAEFRRGPEPGGEHRGAVHLADGCGAIDLPQPQLQRAGERVAGIERQPGGGRTRPAIDGSGGVPHADESQLPGHAGDGDGSREPGRLDPLATRPASTPSRRDPWGDFIVVHCADGKARRLKSGLAPLVDGIPQNTRAIVARLQELGFSTGDSKRIVREAKSSRTGRLQGYGNAIVTQLAAEFIRVVMEYLK